MRYVLVANDRGKMIYNQVKNGKKPYSTEKDMEVSRKHQ